MNTKSSTRMRLRVRPLASVEPKDRRAASRLTCLSIPHLGEAIDRASHSYELRKAEEGAAWEREFHNGHAHGTACGEEGTRCVYVDYVPESEARSDDELDPTGIVAKSK